VDSTSVVLAALGGLAPRQRAVLVLRYLEDLSEAQVAEILGCSVGNVKSTAWRALERLRLVLDPDRTADIRPFGHDGNDTNGANHDERATRI
jgi:DNA-directed RNA polymerase specialized sigma24 family protein